jgi:hypothetical protein
MLLEHGSEFGNSVIDHNLILARTGSFLLCWCNFKTKVI